MRLQNSVIGVGEWHHNICLFKLIPLWLGGGGQLQSQYCISPLVTISHYQSKTAVRIVRNTWWVSWLGQLAVAFSLNIRPFGWLVGLDLAGRIPGSQTALQYLVCVHNVYVCIHISLWSLAIAGTSWRTVYVNIQVIHGCTHGSVVLHGTSIVLGQWWHFS